LLIARVVTSCADADAFPVKPLCFSAHAPQQVPPAPDDNNFRDFPTTSNSNSSISSSSSGGGGGGGDGRYGKVDANVLRDVKLYINEWVEAQVPCWAHVTHDNMFYAPTGRAFVKLAPSTEVTAATDRG
jgi:hypothetical protein